MAEFDVSKLKKTERVEEKKEPKKMERVVTGKAKSKKKSEASKIASIFFPGEITDIKSFFINEVIIPNVKKAIVDGVDMLLYGETRKRSGSSKINYGGIYSSSRLSSEKNRTDRVNTIDYDDIEFDNRGDAELVLSTLEDTIDSYGFTTVADFYDLAGISTSNYMANKYGWNNLAMADVRRTRDGYIIKLPKAMPIDKF